MEFDHCSVKFSHDGDLGIPATILKSSSKSYVSFRGGFFAFYHGVFSIMGTMGNYSFQGGVVFENASVRSHDYERFAESGTAGGIVFAGSTFYRRPSEFIIKHSSYFGEKKIFKEISFPDVSSSSEVPSIYTALVIGSNHGNGANIPKVVNTPLFYKSHLKSEFLNMKLIERELSITFPETWSDLQYIQEGGLPGDLIVDNSTGSVFMIYTKTKNVVRAKLQNNYRKTTSKTIELLIPVEVNPNQSISLIACRVFTPSTYTIGTFTKGSNTITNVGRDDGSAAHLETEFRVGNAIMTDPETDNLFSYTGSSNVITNVDPSSRTVTMIGKALKTERRRIAIVILPGMKNL
jgi:hypothetical protein